MSAVLDLCDRWDALSKGESPTTAAIRTAHAEDLAAVSLCSQCGEMPSAMIKIGTTDGWCTRCLDEAAEAVEA